VTGVCTERVVIQTDRLTIDGEGTAVLSGTPGGPLDFNAVLTVDGARGVVIKGLTVQNSPAEGILGLRGAAFSVVDTQVRDNAFTGISVGDGSTADLTDIVIQRSNPGLDVYNNSSAILHRSIAITHNTGNGVEINGLAVVEIRGAKVNASDNAGSGVAVGSGQLAIFGLPSSAGSALTASNNRFAGINVAGSLFSVYPDATVTASSNGVFGIRLVAGGAFLAALSLVGTSTFVIEDNGGAGVSAEQGAGAFFRSVRLTVKGNGVGLSGDGAGTLTVLADPAVPSVISGNTLDVNLVFGTRAHFQGVTIGSIACDATVLIRGTTVCP
jgi:Right handed beta helix region